MHSSKPMLLSSKGRSETRDVALFVVGIGEPEVPAKGPVVVGDTKVNVGLSKLDDDVDGDVDEEVDVTDCDIDNGVVEDDPEDEYPEPDAASTYPAMPPPSLVYAAPVIAPSLSVAFVV